MKPLILTDSPLYLRRLVRELNQAGLRDGFYTRYGDRCNRARRLSDGTLQVRRIGGTWIQPSLPHSFSDAYGREIIASRSPR